MQLSFFKNENNFLAELLSREYLLTNGKGSYASSTLADCHIRKYHSLLALPIKEIHKNYSLLAKVEVSLVINSKQYDLSTNKFPGTYFPEGYKFIKAFLQRELPQVVYFIEKEAIELIKTTLMVRGEDAVYIKYDLKETPKSLTLKLAPFLAYREIHQLAGQNIDIRPRTYFEANGFKIDPYAGLPALYLQTSRHSTFFPAPDWWKSFEYPAEKERGYAHQEDLFCPGIFEIKLKKGESLILRAGLSPLEPFKIKKQWEKEEKRLNALLEKYQSEKEPLKTIKLEAEKYLIDDPVSILAGFPWFSNEWGRDTFISLPGLLLCTGRFEQALKIFMRFARFLKNGLLPNTIEPGEGQPSYNAVDVPFWFCLAAQRYLAYTGDKKNFEKTILPTIISILNAFIEKKCPLGQVKEDGLLYAGEASSQVTWMDAKVKGVPVTPRQGAAVEINALYYNALCFVLEEFQDLLSALTKKQFKAARELFATNFPLYFWNEEESCLVDVFRSLTDRDPKIRPNMLFAIGLPYTCLDKERAELVLEKVKNQLLTPYGLRSLSIHDMDFKAEYSGNEEERDKAYHQGLIWPWLIGIYWDAVKKLNPDFKAACSYIRNTFLPLWKNHLTQGCLLQISELFDPLKPHLPKGCPAQAWSLAEVLRVLTETEA